MQIPSVHHLVTIRLEDHVEQLEQTHRALTAVRSQLSQIQQSLERASLNIIQPPPRELNIALRDVHTTSDIIDSILEAIQPPNCGRTDKSADVN